MGTYTVYRSRTPGYWWNWSSRSFTSLPEAYSYAKKNLNYPYWNLVRGSKESDFTIASSDSRTVPKERWTESVLLDSEYNFYDRESRPRQKLSQLGLKTSEIDQVLDDR